MHCAFRAAVSGEDYSATNITINTICKSRLHHRFMLQLSETIKVAKRNFGVLVHHLNVERRKALQKPTQTIMTGKLLPCFSFKMSPWLWN